MYQLPVKPFMATFSLDLHCVPQLNADSLGENYAKPYSHAKHLE